MSNFLEDNPDLRFYIEKAIDWPTLIEQVELHPEDEDAPSTVEEAVEFYEEVLNLIGRFSAREIAPHTRELDKQEIELVDGEAIFPPRLESIFDKIRDLDLHGMCLPRELGGLNCPLLVYMLSAELMARGDVSVMTHHGFHGGIAMALMIYSMEEGTTTFDHEKGRLIDTRFSAQIKDIISGNAWGSMDITEPAAGSDMGALGTRATQDADGNWTLTGEKIFITSGHGRYHVVIARTSDPSDTDGLGLDGLSLFLVEAWREDENGNRERLAHLGRVEEKLGHHASATVSVIFDNTPAQLIGEVGGGFNGMLLLMNNARIAVGFESLGLCESAYRLAYDYAQERHSMGKAIAQHELIADMLDEMRTDIQGIRALAVKGAQLTELYNRLRQRQKHMAEPDSEEAEALGKRIRKLKWECRLLTPLVKFVGSEKAVEMGRRCVQIHGGCGYTTEYGAEKLLRDALVLPIYEGTTQIQALMATKDALLAITKDPSRFIRRLTDTWRRSIFATDSLERRVATIQYRALSAQKALIMRIVRQKWTDARQDSQLTLRQAFKHWDPKSDFGPALLHAENLAWLLTDATACEELMSQAQQWPERRELLARYVERAEPRTRDLLHRIENTGDRLLGILAEQKTEQKNEQKADETTDPEAKSASEEAA